MGKISVYLYVSGQTAIVIMKTTIKWLAAVPFTATFKKMPTVNTRECQ